MSAAGLLVLVGFVVVVGWIVQDASTGSTARGARVVILLAGGVALVAGALLLPGYS